MNFIFTCISYGKIFDFLSNDKKYDYELIKLYCKIHESVPLHIFDENFLKLLKDPYNANEIKQCIYPNSEHYVEEWIPTLNCISRYITNLYLIQNIKFNKEFMNENKKIISNTKNKYINKFLINNEYFNKIIDRIGNPSNYEPYYSYDERIEYSIYLIQKNKEKINNIEINHDNINEFIEENKNEIIHIKEKLYNNEQTLKIFNDVLINIDKKLNQDILHLNQNNNLLYNKINYKLINIKKKYKKEKNYLINIIHKNNINISDLKNDNINLNKKLKNINNYIIIFMIIINIIICFTPFYI